METLRTKAQAQTFIYWLDHSSCCYYHAPFGINPCICRLQNYLILSCGLILNSCAEILGGRSVCVIELPVNRVYADGTIQNHEVLFAFIPRSLCILRDDDSRIIGSPCKFQVLIRCKVIIGYRIAYDVCRYHAAEVLRVLAHVFAKNITNHL